MNQRIRIRSAALLASFAIAVSAETVTIPVNLSLVHGVSIGEVLPKEKTCVSNLMVSVITGQTDSLQGAQFGSIYNEVNGSSEGAQFAGIINRTEGSHIGYQAAGVINSTGSGLVGVQAAGVVNSAGNTVGAQFSGVVSRCDRLIGLQQSGVVNSADSVTGAQFAGVVNSSESIEGAQFAGAVNVSGNVKGVQAAGIVNSADTVDGIQIGLINTANHNKGAAIGLISIDRSYGIGAMVWTDENLFVTAALRTGNKNIYNLLTFGVRPDDNSFFSVGAGIGTRIPVNSRFSIDVDYLFSAIGEHTPADTDQFRGYTQDKLRLFADVVLFKKCAVFGGISGGRLYSQSGAEASFMDGIPSHSRNTFWGDHVTYSPGVFAGVRIN